MIEIITYIILIVWGIGTTIYGLYLSRLNNEKYNKEIISVLEEIKYEIETIGGKIK